MSKFIKRIQSSLSREGIKKTYAEIREELNAIASDPNNPTLDDIKEVKESLSKQSSQIAEVEKEETKDIGHVNLSKRQGQEETALTTTDKQELVQQQSVEMGIALSEQDVIAIASNSDDQVADGVAFLEEAKGLITQYLASQVNAYKQQSTQLLGEINGAVNDAQSQISQIDDGINQGLNQILGGVAATAERRKSTNNERLARLRAALNPGN